MKAKTVLAEQKQNKKLASVQESHSALVKEMDLLRIKHCEEFEGIKEEYRCAVEAEQEAKTALKKAMDTLHEREEELKMENCLMEEELKGAFDEQIVKKDLLLKEKVAEIEELHQRLTEMSEEKTLSAAQKYELELSMKSQLKEMRETCQKELLAKEEVESKLKQELEMEQQAQRELIQERSTAEQELRQKLKDVLEVYQETNEECESLSSLNSELLKTMGLEKVEQMRMNSEILQLQSHIEALEQLTSAAHLAKEMQEAHEEQKKVSISLLSLMF